jgi:hypothetical protein
VCVQVSAGCLRVEVHDEGGPWNQEAHSGNGTHGRGLLIVGRLTRAWGEAATATQAGGSGSKWNARDQPTQPTRARDGRRDGALPPV